MCGCFVSARSPLPSLLAPSALRSRQARSPQDAATWVDALRTVCGRTVCGENEWTSISAAGTAAVAVSPHASEADTTPPKPPRQGAATSGRLGSNLHLLLH